MDLEADGDRYPFIRIIFRIVFKTVEFTNAFHDG